MPAQNDYFFFFNIFERLQVVRNIHHHQLAWYILVVFSLWAYSSAAIVAAKSNS